MWLAEAMRAESADVARLRIAAQRLAGSDLPDAASVVTWLGCVQAQDLPGSLTSVALRTPDRSLAGVRDALGSARIVRSWPMRGTLHLVPARDIRWMTDLTHPRTFAQSRRRREALGIDEAMIERAWELFVDAHTERGPLPRAEVLRAWSPLGVEEVKGRGYHLFLLLCQMGRMAQGPHDGSETRFVDLDAWTGHHDEPSREEALARWAEMYFRSHGPATEKDFARWTGLTMANVRAGIADASGLERVDIDGTAQWMDPATPDRAAQHRDEIDAIHLLPGFDELILGYADRTATLAKHHEQLVVPGNNGMFKPTIISASRAVGTWSVKKATKTLPERLLPTGFTARLPATSKLERAFAALPS